MKGIVPVKLTDSTNRAEVRAFIRAFKSDTASALNLQENSDRVEVLDESQVVQTDQGVSISFMVHEPRVDKVFVHESRRRRGWKEKISGSLSTGYVEEQSDKIRHLFKKSARNLVAVTTGPTIKFKFNPD